MSHHHTQYSGSGSGSRFGRGASLPTNPSDLAELLSNNSEDVARALLQIVGSRNSGGSSAAAAAETSQRRGSYRHEDESRREPTRREQPHSPHQHAPYQHTTHQHSPYQTPHHRDGALGRLAVSSSHTSSPHTSSSSSSSPATFSLPFSAMTDNMPSVFIGHLNVGIDAEDVAAAMLLHWGIPSKIRILARFERKGGYGNGRFATRWRSVEYDEDGAPVEVTIRDLHGAHTFDYEEERYPPAGSALDEEGEGDEGGRAGEDKVDDEGERGSGEAPKRAAAAAAPPATVRAQWASVVEEYDGAFYEPTGQMMAVVELHRWYTPSCDPIRQALLAGEQIVLNVDPQVTRGWRFFKCVLGHKRAGAGPA